MCLVTQVDLSIILPRLRSNAMQSISEANQDTRRFPAAWSYLFRKADSRQQQHDQQHNKMMMKRQMSTRLQLLFFQEK